LRQPTGLACFGALVVLICYPYVAGAQWLSNGNELCDTCSAGLPAIVPDGQGGLLAVWEDDTYGAGSYQLYAQHMTPDGLFALGWPTHGFGLFVGIRRGDDDVLTQAVPDGAGGMLFAVTGYPGAGGTGNAFYQHVRGDGTWPPGWPTTGAPVGIGPVSQRAVSVSPDGVGGVLGFWENDPYPYIYAQHFLASGAPDPAWPSGSRAYCPLTTGGRGDAISAPDGSGGAIVVWEDSRQAAYQYDYDLFAQHLQADATIAPGWPAYGLPISLAPNGQSMGSSTGSLFLVISDGAGGAYAAWTDFRTAPPNTPIGGDIYMMRVSANGTFPPGWPLNGLAVAAVPGSQNLDDLIPDGTGGAFIA
jgi:hypothetical protein